MSFGHHSHRNRFSSQLFFLFNISAVVSKSLCISRWFFVSIDVIDVSCFFSSDNSFWRQKYYKCVTLSVEYICFIFAWYRFGSFHLNPFSFFSPLETSSFVVFLFCHLFNSFGLEYFAVFIALFVRLFAGRTFVLYWQHLWG